MVVPSIDDTLGLNTVPCITANTEEIASGIAGGVAVVFIIVGLIIYRNWRYEQELDSLLWKIDYKDIQIPDLPPLSSGQGKASRVRKASLFFLIIIIGNILHNVRTREI